MPKQDLNFQSPLLNAAGSLGFAPDARGPVNLDLLGGFVTNPISLAPRSPASGPRLARFPGGVLIHTGLPNHGLKPTIQRYRHIWEQSTLPIIVHFIAEDPESVSYAVEQLEEVEGVAGIEIGLPPQAGLENLPDFAQAAAGELPYLIRIPSDWALRLGRMDLPPGLAALSLGPPRGALPGRDGGFIQGRLYGPSLFPLALMGVLALVQAGIPVIGAGGVYRENDFNTILRAGAIAVQVDLAFWRGGWPEKGHAAGERNRPKA